MQIYNSVDQQLHLLSQIIAKANRSFVPWKEDDSHTNLYFDPLENRLLGRWISTHHGRRILGLNLKNLCFEWLDSSMRVTQSTHSVGLKYSEIEDALEPVFRDCGLDVGGFKKPLHFEITNYASANDRVSEISMSDIEKWAFYRRLANSACETMLGNLQTEGEIRIWPHHFDTGIFCKPTERMGLGFGLAMQDNLAGAPYFYLSGYAEGFELDYSKVPEMHVGKWINQDNWKGAILPLTRIDRLDTGESEKMIWSYLKTTLNWFIKQ